MPALDIPQIKSGGHFEISSEVFVQAKFYFRWNNYS